jgi:hypothetical protein
MKHLFFIAVAFLFFACGSDKEVLAENTASDSSSCAKPSVNPNGDSELALLMREMVATTQSIKDSLSAGKNVPVYPEHFGKIFFAQKTDSTIDKELFNTLAQGYIGNLKYFYGASEKEKVTAFNAMVNSCAACHQNFCGGPLKRIHELLLPEKVSE